MKIVFKYILSFAAIFCSGTLLFSQNIDTTSNVAKNMVQDSVKSVSKFNPSVFIENAKKAYLNYDFRKALDLFEKAQNAIPDSLDRIQLDDDITMTENCINMMDFCSTPVVVAKQKFSLDDFFLFYPLGDGCWRPVPNQLDTVGNGSLIKAMYVPDDAETIYYSVKDEDDIRNIYKTEKQDSVWSVPELLGESMTSSSDEVFPMLSLDGKSLYFASKGLYGIGGYDLYVSNWDENMNEWGVPINLGFPYSSPYDDYLYVNTPDGKYSMFASNRDCEKDSVWLYVLEYDDMPIRKAYTDVTELRNLMKLEPVQDPSRLDNGSTVAQNPKENKDLALYSAKMSRVRELSDSLNTFTRVIDDAREKLSEAKGNEKDNLIALITERETKIPVLQDSLEAARKQVQEIEMKFLMSGVVIDPEMVRNAVDKEVVGAASSYTFTKNHFGPRLDIKVLKPEPKFDYSFKILPEGCFAEDNTLPEGLVYQIQIFTQGRKATVKDIRGLSPVFEKQNRGRYTYSVGLFHSYKDVLSNLNKVKKQGFRSAIITAYMDGKAVSIRNARNIEKNVQILYSIRIFPNNGANLSSSELSAIQATTSVDIARTTDDGIISFIVGPFSDKSVAEEVLDALKKEGVTNTRLESAKM